MWSAASKFYLLMMQTYQKYSVKVKRDVGRNGGWGGGGGLKVISPLDGGATLF